MDIHSTAGARYWPTPSSRAATGAVMPTSTRRRSGPWATAAPTKVSPRAAFLSRLKARIMNTTRGRKETYDFVFVFHSSIRLAMGWANSFHPNNKAIFANKASWITSFIERAWALGFSKFSQDKFINALNENMKKPMRFKNKQNKTAKDMQILIFSRKYTAHTLYRSSVNISFFLSVPRTLFHMKFTSECHM
jgi:hypothetical protein